LVNCDPGVHERAVSPWELLITPLSAGPYRHVITYLATPRLILYRSRFFRKTRLLGLSPPNMFSVCVPLRADAGLRLWGERLHASGLPMLWPGGLHVEAAEGTEYVVAMIDLGLLRASVPEELYGQIRAACRQHVFPAPGSAVTRLGAALVELIDEARACPDALGQPQAVQALESDLPALFRRSLPTPAPIRPRRGRAMRQRGLQKAIEYLRSGSPASISVADLCRAACVTERTLQYAFRENFGVSPLRLLQLRRFHAARRRLLAADPPTSTVKDIALEHGFYQMGRFAIRYRTLFGESPSQSLQRPPVEPSGCLGLKSGFGPGLRR
jgi:AraC-like DNA-binding protein